MTAPPDIRAVNHPRGAARTGQQRPNLIHMGRGKTRKQAESEIYGGAIAVAALWVASPLSAIFFPVIAVASGLLAGFSLCTMPTWCCAERSRGGPCKGKTRGVFVACEEPSHVDQKGALLRTRAYWIGLARGDYSGSRRARAVYLAGAAILSGLVALIFTLLQ
ncbi:hypothetical protein [Amycolatopsis sp. RTGN1]|uniref:hypothetical protein n=1 Tax=Amycolatopsis ponsaeliensis TaxID=2992142 RepID=UPI00254CDB39|nr:hypothetical protein [Amycolatopsis sp. RTGN1]